MYEDWGAGVGESGWGEKHIFNGFECVLDCNVILCVCVPISWNWRGKPILFFIISFSSLCFGGSEFPTIFLNIPKDNEMNIHFGRRYVCSKRFCLNIISSVLLNNWAGLHLFADIAFGASLLRFLRAFVCSNRIPTLRPDLEWISLRKIRSHSKPANWHFSQWPSCFPFKWLSILLPSHPPGQNSILNLTFFLFSLPNSRHISNHFPLKHFPLTVRIHHSFMFLSFSSRLSYWAVLSAKSFFINLLFRPSFDSIHKYWMSRVINFPEIKIFRFTVVQAGEKRMTENRNENFQRKSTWIHLSLLAFCVPCLLKTGVMCMFF